MGKIIGAVILSATTVAGAGYEYVQKQIEENTALKSQNQTLTMKLARENDAIDDAIKALQEAKK